MQECIRAQCCRMGAGEHTSADIAEYHGIANIGTDRCIQNGPDREQRIIPTKDLVFEGQHLNPCFNLAILKGENKNKRAIHLDNRGPPDNALTNQQRGRGRGKTPRPPPSEPSFLCSDSQGTKDFPMPERALDPVHASLGYKLKGTTHLPVNVGCQAYGAKQARAVGHAPSLGCRRPGAWARTAIHGQKNFCGSSAEANCMDCIWTAVEQAMGREEQTKKGQGQADHEAGTTGGEQAQSVIQNTLGPWLICLRINFAANCSTKNVSIEYRMTCF